MKKVLGTILFVLYAIIAITVTVLLLSYNDYNNSQIGGYTVYIVKDDSLEPEYKQGSILLIKSTNDKNVQVGDKMFLYKVINSQEYEVIERTLESKKQQGRHIVYYVENEETYANDYFIGKTSDVVVIQGWGYVLNLLESKWGYLFCVVVVSLLLFLQEVFELAMEIKYGGGKKKSKAVEAEFEEEPEDEKNAGRAEAVAHKTAEGAHKTATKTTTRKPATKTTTRTRTTSSASATGTAKPRTRTSGSASATGTAKPRTRTSGSASAAKKAATATKTTSSAKGASAKKTSKEEE